MKNKGRGQHRFQENPIEKVFAQEWDKLNSSGHHTTLDYLMAKEINHPNNEVTPRDVEVAATVIQWLGSPVGQCWLSEVDEKLKKMKLK